MNNEKLKIKLSPENQEKITELLNSVQRRARERVFNIDDIYQMTANLERRMDALGLPKKYRVGTTY